MKNAEYDQTWRKNRRVYLIGLLGGKCVKCGASDALEFDHIDPATKCFSLGSVPQKPLLELEAEARKCRLLCAGCHKARHRQTEHGTLAMYRYCKCIACRKAKSDWQKTYMRTRSSTD